MVESSTSNADAFESWRQRLVIGVPDVALVRERLEAEQRSSQLSAEDPNLTTYQQDMAAARGWAFGLAIEILDGIR